MAKVVKTFVGASSTFKTELLVALAKAPKPLRQIEVVMTDDYKRGERAWRIDDPLTEDALREMCEFVDTANSQGMREGMIALSDDD